MNRIFGNAQNNTNASLGGLGGLFSNIIPGGLSAGINRVVQKVTTDPLSLTPLSMREEVVPSAVYLGKALGNQQAGEDIGYGLRGALSITPFQRSKSLGGKLELTTPTTERQKNVERLGRAVYGTAMTLPLGGAAAIPGRVAAGATLGAGITGVGKVLTTGKLPTLNELGQGAAGGVENSWVLAFTGLGLDKALGAAATKVPWIANLTSGAAGAPLKALATAAPEAKLGLLGKGFAQLLGRAVLETVPENTAFTLLDKISGKDARPFVKAWVENLPGSLVGNVAFALANGTVSGVYNWNKDTIDGAVESLKKSLKQVNIEDIPIGMQAKPKGGMKAIGSAQEIADLEKQYQTAVDSGNEAEQARLAGLMQQKSAEAGVSRPSTQVQLEQANNAGDFKKVGEILDSIPADDPFKQSMESIFRPKVEAMTQRPLLDQLVAAQQSGDMETVKRITDQIRTEGTQQAGAVPNKIGGENTTQTTELTPEQKVMKILQVAEPVRAKQQAGYSTELAQRAGAVEAIGNTVPGMEGYIQQRAAQSGALPKEAYSGGGVELTQNDLVSLFKQAQDNPALQPFDKVNTKGAIIDLLNGKLPTNSQIELLNKTYSPEFVQTVLDNRPALQKYIAGAAEVLNVPRALMASVDLSAPMRQGLILTVSRPTKSIPDFVDSIKYFANEGSYQDAMKAMESDPLFPLAQQAGLSRTTIDNPTLTGREESFMSNLAEKIPGIGGLVRASDRAYTGFLDKLRFDVFKDIVNGAQDEGLTVTPELASSAAKYVNSASGRGDMGRFAQHAVLLNSVFFSPRLMASRLNFFDPRFYASLDPYVRQQAVKGVLQTAGTIISALTLAKLGGAQVSGDPTNADFGKVKIGDTRLDFTGGFGQYLRLIGQLTTGKITSSITGKEIVLNEGTYKPIGRGDVITRFLQSKESPILGFATGLLNNQTALGEPFQVGPEIADRFIPLVLQDFHDVIQSQGISGIPLVLPGIVGVGVQTYGKKIPVKGFTAGGNPNIQYRNPPSLGESLINKVPLINQILGTKGLNDFTPAQQKSMWDAELKKKIAQTVTDKVNSIKADYKMKKITYQEMVNRINATQKQAASSISPLQNILPMLNSGGTPVTNNSTTRSNRMFSNP